MRKNLYVTCAAIHYDTKKYYPFQQPVNIDHGIVVCGWNHRHCLVMGRMAQIPKRTKRTLGFITSRREFIDPVKAAEIALKAGQIPPEEWAEGAELYVL